MKQVYKGQTIAVHVLGEHILPQKPLPLPLGGTKEQWDAYWKRALEILGPEYDEQDLVNAEGYFITMVEDVVGDQVLFRDSYGEPRLVSGDEVITKEEAPKAFEVWLSQIQEENFRQPGKGELMKNPKVTITNSAHGYILDVAVYRHVTTPDEISVHIQAIHPIPPSAPEIPDDPVRRLVHPGSHETIEAVLYPPQKKD